MLNVLQSKTVLTTFLSWVWKKRVFVSFIHYQPIFEVLSKVLSVTIVSRQLMKVVKERAIYVLQTALCVKFSI